MPLYEKYTSSKLKELLPQLLYFELKASILFPLYGIDHPKETVIETIRKRIGIIGFGALGQQLYSIFLKDQSLERLVLFDDSISNFPEAERAKFHDHLDPNYADLSFIVCLGYKHLSTKTEILASLESNGRAIATFVHESAFVHPSALLGKGCIIYPMCNIDINVRLARGVLLNNSVTISHDSAIGEGSFLAPGVTVCGNAMVGSHTFVGAGAVLSNGITVGNNCQVGLATALTKTIPNGSAVIGNPARVLSGRLQLL